MDETDFKGRSDFDVARRRSRRSPVIPIYRASFSLHSLQSASILILQRIAERRIKANYIKVNYPLARWIMKNLVDDIRRMIEF